MKKSLLISVALLLIIPILLAGCSFGKKEIILWNPFTGADGEYFSKMVEEYNAIDGHDYKIKNIVVPDMYTKIYTVTNSGKDKDVPDLAVIHAERIPLFVVQNLLDPMDNILKDQSNINESAYLPQTWEAGNIDGKRYSVPLDIHSSVLYYNKDLLDKYAPEALDDEVITIDEINAIADKAKEDGKITYPMNVETWLSLSLTVQNGGNIHDGDTPTINTPEMKKSLETLRGFVESGASQEDGDDVSQLFQSGESVFLQDGTWYAGGLKDIEDLNWGVTNTPAYSPDKIVNWSSSHQFATLKKDRKEEVEQGIGDFLEFVREKSMLWAESGQNAASTEVYESDEYEKMPQSFLMKDDKQKESMVIFDFANYGNTSEAIGSVARDIIYGRMDIDEGLEQAQKTVDDKLKEGK
ncbi:ABC transporter substrate-binding protein [Bacillus sp. J14TS2]|uniref:extracellular solute-binding protein n=1 Tax=Bacillus sp. J14TS2 TaxID=2807188 RepID=UPI001B139EA2|nr:extracellular solute-binding protein [Bacillus sp. J14TS2]GIN71448.1 ABC transporter substrate-binding protein [Bacillus sp. J14TS2]